ncbi:MAG: hypothetical protein JJE47_07305 [Acidimicrobiia bacterium]|nr:hypothetical protein [Acidimicrobiia bacterium]
MESEREPSSSPFGVRPGEMIRQAWTAYWANRYQLTLWSFVSLVTYYASIQLVSEDQTAWTQVGFLVAGMVATTTVAYPWFRLALASIDGTAAPFHVGRFYDQAVASAFFWAGVLLGFRYLYGIPALFVLVMYAFFGYAVVEEPRRGGLKALGWSVQVGTKRRVGIFAIVALLLTMNLLAFIPIGLGTGSLFVAATALLLTVTTNVSIVSGAVVYRALERTAPKR